jgi:hypothetical protein
VVTGVLLVVSISASAFNEIAKAAGVPSSPTARPDAPAGLLEQDRSAGTTVQEGINFAGWTVNAFSGPKASASLRALAATGANWVSIVVTQYQDTADSTSIFPGRGTVSDTGLAGMIEQARALHLNVSLDPHVNTLTGAFRGTIGTSFTPEQWTTWFASYRTFILHYATLAQRLGVGQLVVGTELEQASTHADDWKSLVTDIRRQFGGSLTYAANHGGEEEAIKWWNVLDYIGIDAYYPVDPSQPDFGWSRYIATLSALSARWGNKPILLTEIGYRSVVGSPDRPWDSTMPGNVSTETQAAAYAGAFHAFASEPWFAGMYWWVWSPEIPNGPQDDGYSPQNKPAEQQLAIWYGRL